LPRYGLLRCARNDEKQPGVDRLADRPRHPLFSPPSHFPFGPKRFMVPARFALGEINS